MTDLDRQVVVTQRRLWTNAWFARCCWGLTGAAGSFAAIVVAERLFDLGWPLGLIAVALAGVGIVVGSVWTIATRTTREEAAAHLDEAAGLRERISTGLYCRDPRTQEIEAFAGAVIADAERIAAKTSARLHVPYRAPFALAYTGMSVIAAALLLLLPTGLLIGETPSQTGRDTPELQRAKAVVKEKMDAIKKVAQTNPALKDLQEKLEQPERPPEGALDTPQAVRHEALKQIDKLSDALRERQKSEQSRELQEMKKMLRGIKAPGENKTPAQKLTKALAEGDFKEAQEQIKAMQEQLATLKPPQDLEKLEATKKQLEELAKKLSKVSDQKQLKEKLEQAGIKKEDLERMLKRLSKQDLEQIKKALEKSGMTQEQIEKLAQQMQQQKKACSQCKQMGQAMKQAADAAGAGESAQAIASLDSAAEQLSEMEMLEQEMAQVDSALADLQNTANELDSCSNCNGKGCNQCNGTGMSQSGMGPKAGRGKGSLAQEQATATRFQTHRQKVTTTPGRIIGQFLVDGQQVKGDVGTELAEVVAAEERDATDLIHRDRIPRQYHQSVKDYFSSVQRQIGGDGSITEEEAAEPDSTDAAAESAD